MSTWEITKEVADWVLRAGGVLAAAIWIIQNFLKGWISDHFATKKEVRGVQTELQKISAGATSSLRVKAIEKIIELRFHSIGEIQTAASAYFKALSGSHTTTRLYHKYHEEATASGELNVLEEKLSKADEEYFEAVRNFREVLLLHKPYIPHSLSQAGAQLVVAGQDLTERLSNEESGPPSEVSFDPISDAMTNLGRAVVRSIVSAPDLANDLYPEKAKTDAPLQAV